MTHVGSRSTGAMVCAVVILMSLTGCGDQPSVLAPRVSIAPEITAQSSDISLDSKPSGNPGWTLYNSDFRVTNRDGGYSTDPATWVQLDVVAGAPFTVNWVGRFRGGVHLHAYRWTLDIADLSDETPRIDEATDLAHWSAPSATTTSATVGPFAAGEQHFLYVEVTDTNGFKSLATLNLHVVESLSEEVRRH